MTIQDVTTPTSRAIASGTATADKAINVSGSSSAIVAGTATPYRLVAATGASAAVASSSATPKRLADAVGASAAIASGSATASLVRDVIAASAALAYSSARYDSEALESWAVNLINQAIGRYTAFDFNSFAVVGDRLFGFGDDGIFEISGATDDGAAIPFFLMSESTSKTGPDASIIQPHTAYVVGALPDGLVDAEFFVVTDGDETYSYPLGNTETRLETSRVLLGRGLRSRFLRYGVFGSASGSVELASIMVKAADSKRNV